MRQAAPTKKGPSKTLKLMQKMLKSVKQTERRCEALSKTVDKKLEALLTQAQQPETSNMNGSSVSAAPINTSTPSRPTQRTRPHGDLTFDPEWETLAPQALAQPPLQRKPKNNTVTASFPRTIAIANNGWGPGDAQTDTSVRAKPPSATRRHCRQQTPTAVPKTSAAAEEALRLIADAAQTKTMVPARKKGIHPDYLFPYDLVERGDGGKPIKKGEATREEFSLGLIRLQLEPTFPPDSINALVSHHEMIAYDNCSLPWHIVRRYSEETFTRIADGRLPHGWLDPVAINAVRLETLATSNIAAGELPSESYRNSNSNNPKNPYDKETMGSPCSIWNRDQEKCDKASKGEAHGNPPNKYIHICGYCANVRHIVAAHPENKCYTKKSRTKRTDNSAAQVF